MRRRCWWRELGKKWEYGLRVVKNTGSHHCNLFRCPQSIAAPRLKVSRKLHGWLPGSPDLRKFQRLLCFRSFALPLTLGSCDQSLSRCECGLFLKQCLHSFANSGVLDVQPPEGVKKKSQQAFSFNNVIAFVSIVRSFRSDDPRTSAPILSSIDRSLITRPSAIRIALHLSVWKPLYRTRCIL